MIVALIAVCLLVFAYGAHRVVSPFIDRALKIAEQRTAVSTKATESEIEVRTQKPAERPPVPMTVLMIANQESERWAREQAIDAFCEWYDETKDWNQVQTRALNIQAQALQRRGMLS